MSIFSIYYKLKYYAFGFLAFTVKKLIFIYGKIFLLPVQNRACSKM